MTNKMKHLILLSVIVLAISLSARGGEKYDAEFLKRQFEFYSPDIAQEAIKQGEYTKAAINALSIYPIASEDSIRIALLLEDKIKEPLPQFLFKAYREMGISSDPSVKLKKDGETIFVEEWINQKAKWSDDFINEIRCYLRIREEFKNDQKDFPWGAFHTYYLLDNEEAFAFLEKLDKKAARFMILNLYEKAATTKDAANIKELNGIDPNNLSKAMKEMLTTLKGDYYMSQKDFKNAKESYLEFFELDYSLPVHIENLAMCYLAEGNRDKAKSLYLHLTKLFQMGNITVDGIYNLACIWAQEGDKEKALSYLTEAIKQGFPKSHAKNDDDFKSLRDDKRFIELVK